MNRVWHTSAKILTGLFVTALYAMPQAYTISARPGAINYIEGSVAINGAPIQGKSTKGKAFLNANDTLTTEHGKAEVLLTPGVFLRLDTNSEVKMISPSLTSTQIELVKGNAMVEAAQLLKENDIQIVDHGAVIQLKKTGLYRFTADDPAVAQTLDGKAEVSENGRAIGIGKNHEVVLSDAKAQRVEDHPEHTDLYAWSKVRDEYVAAASYSSAQNVTTVPGGGWGWGQSALWGGGLYGAGFGPGWAWNPFWDTYAWLPGSGAFYSPFGYGFYAPGLVAYAPVVVAPVGGRPVTVPVNPARPGTGTTVPVRTPVISGGRPVMVNGRPAMTTVPAHGSAPRVGSAGTAMPHASAGAGMPHMSPGGAGMAHGGGRR